MFGTSVTRIQGTAIVAASTGVLLALAGVVAAPIGAAGLLLLVAVAVTGSSSRAAAPTAPQQARETEQHLALALSASAMGAWQWDLKTNAIVWDDVMRALFGLDPGAPIETFDECMRLIHPDDVEALKARLARSITTGDDYDHEFRVVWSDGTVRRLEGRGAMDRDDTGRPACMLGVCWDVTLDKEAGASLRTSEARYRGLVESQQDLVFRFDLEERVTFANDAYCARFGLTREEVLGNGLTHLHPDDRDATTAAIAALLTPPHRAMLENRIRTPQGWRWVSWSACAIQDQNGRVVEIQCAGRDVTERHVAEDGLRTSIEALRLREERLRLLAQRLVAVRDDERRRLGLDLHDGVCQDLVGIAMLVGSLRHRLPSAPAEVTTTLAHVERHLQTVGDHLRDLAHELRPMLLHDLGLEGSLRALVDGFSAGPTRVSVTFTTPISRLGEPVETAVYRIAQEALANAIRHAAASEVTLTLGIPDAVHLEVHDDGCGFEPEESGRSHSIGLASIAERALAIGGTLVVDSLPGAGTTVRFSCPRDAQGDAAVAASPPQDHSAPT